MKTKYLSEKLIATNQLLILLVCHIIITENFESEKSLREIFALG
jgi:hypothetical protein